MAELWTRPHVGYTMSRRLATGLTRAEIARYAGASGDVNLIHVDEPYATEVGGHRAVVAHGMLTMGLTGSFLAAVAGHAHVRRFGGRFLAPVLAGDSLDCTLTVRSVSIAETGTEVALDLVTSRSGGEAVFTGTALACRSATTRQELT